MRAEHRHRQPQRARALLRLRLFARPLALVLGLRLVPLCGIDGTVVDFDLVPADTLEREAALALLERQPPSGQLVICDKGFAEREFEQTAAELGELILRLSRADEPERPAPPIGFIRQRIESIVHALEDQLRLESPSGVFRRRRASTERAVPVSAAELERRATGAIRLARAAEGGSAWKQAPELRYSHPLRRLQPYWLGSVVGSQSTSTGQVR